MTGSFLSNSPHPFGQGQPAAQAAALQQRCLGQRLGFRPATRSVLPPVGIESTGVARGNAGAIRGIIARGCGVRPVGPGEEVPYAQGDYRLHRARWPSAGDGLDGAPARVVPLRLAAAKGGPASHSNRPHQGRWSTTALQQTHDQPTTALVGLLTRRRAQELRRRSRRIAAALSGQSLDQETVRYICELLAQEGDLVGDLMEEIVSRSFRPRPPRPGSEPARDEGSEPATSYRLAS